MDEEWTSAAAHPPVPVHGGSGPSVAGVDSEAANTSTLASAARAEAHAWLHTSPDIALLEGSDTSPLVRHAAFESARHCLRHRSGSLVGQEAAKAVVEAVKGVAPGNWHCVVGPAFGAFVSHEPATKLAFAIGGTGFLLFRHG